MTYVLYFVLVVCGALLGGIIGAMLSEKIAERFHRDRDKAFLRYARVLFPDARVIEAISVAQTDKQAIENIERRLRNVSRTL